MQVDQHRKQYRWKSAPYPPRVREDALLQGSIQAMSLISYPVENYTVSGGVSAITLEQVLLTLPPIAENYSATGSVTAITFSDILLTAPAQPPENYRASGSVQAITFADILLTYSNAREDYRTTGSITGMTLT